MATYHAACFGVHTEVFENSCCGFGVFQQLVEGVFNFGTQLLVFELVEFKGCHLAFGKQRRRHAQPQVPQHVGTLLLRFGVAGGEGVAYGGVHRVEEGTPAKRFTKNTRLHNKAVGCHRHAGMEEQDVINLLVEAAALNEDLHMLLQLFAAAEGLLQVFQHDGFATGEGVGVGGVDGGEDLVLQFKDHVV